MIEGLLLAALAAVLIAPFVRRIHRRDFDPFEPIVLFALAYGAMFLVRPAAMLARGESEFWGVSIESTLLPVIALACVGATGFVVGYETTAGARLAQRLPPPPAISSRRLVAVSAAFGAVGLAALLVLLPLSHGAGSAGLLLGGSSDELGDLIQSSSGYVLFGSLLLLPAGVALLVVALERRHVAAALIGTGLLAAFLLRTLPLGARTALLPLIGGAFMLAYLRRGTRPGPVAIAVVAVVALLGSYTMLVFRYSESRPSTFAAIKAAVWNPTAPLRPIVAGPDGEMAAALAGALTAIPERLPYRFGGATVGDLLRRPVPREVWPDKPLPPREELIRTVWEEPAAHGFSPQFSTLLYFYWDFGAAGVFVGMALAGIAARTLFAYLRAHPGRMAAQTAFALGVWFLVIALRDGPVDTLVLGTFLFVPLLVIFWWRPPRNLSLRARTEARSTP